MEHVGDSVIDCICALGTVPESTENTAVIGNQRKNEDQPEIGQNTDISPGDQRRLVVT